MLSWEGQMCILLGKKLIDVSLEYFGKLRKLFVNKIYDLKLGSKMELNSHGKIRSLMDNSCVSWELRTFSKRLKTQCL